jgi:hypothetical protein
MSIKDKHMTIKLIDSIVAVNPSPNPNVCAQVCARLELGGAHFRASLKLRAG